MGKNTISIKVTVRKAVGEYLEKNKLMSASKITDALWELYLKDNTILFGKPDTNQQITSERVEDEDDIKDRLGKLRSEEKSALLAFLPEKRQ